LRRGIFSLYRLEIEIKDSFSHWPAGPIKENVMRAVLCSALLVVFAVSLAVIASAQSPAPQRKIDTGVEISAAPAAAAAGPTTCKLTLSPNTATNGKTISFSVSYTPCLSVAETETFTFPWRSNLARFTEVTVRKKIFKTSAGCVAASFENTIVPTALAIKGKFNADVVVRDTATNAFICTATAPFTVN
jgi:hypothetical protein